MSKRFSCLVVGLVLCVTPALAGTDQVSIQAMQDNSIFEEGEFSNGAGEHLFSGNTGFDAARRALLSFDIAGNVPAGATITSVSLELNCTASPIVNNAPQPFNLHRLTDDWGEAGSNAGDPGGTGAAADNGDATWTARFFGLGEFWATMGGDFDGTASGSVVVGQCSEAAPLPVTVASTPMLVSDAQGWLDDPGSNFGWIIIGLEEADELFTARRFASSENDERPLGPLLVVDYETGGAPVPAGSPMGTAVLVLLLTAASALVLRRLQRAS